MFNNGRATLDVNKLIPTSKMALKLSCLNACDNNISKANELYEYMTKDLNGLPDTEPTLPSGIQRFKSGADDIIGWVTDHKDLIQQGIALLRGMRKTDAGRSLAGVPPIPKL